MKDFIKFNIVLFLIMVGIIIFYRLQKNYEHTAFIISNVCVVIFVLRAVWMSINLYKLDKEIEALKKENKDLKEYDSMC